MNIDFKDLQLNIEYVDIDAVKPSARNPHTQSRTGSTDRGFNAQIRLGQSDIGR